MRKIINILSIIPFVAIIFNSFAKALNFTDGNFPGPFDGSITFIYTTAIILWALGLIISIRQKRTIETYLYILLFIFLIVFTQLSAGHVGVG